MPLPDFGLQTEKLLARTVKERSLDSPAGMGLDRKDFRRGNTCTCAFNTLHFYHQPAYGLCSCPKPS